MNNNGLISLVSKNTDKNDMVSTDEIFDYLQEEGYRPQKTDDNQILTFMNEGYKYHCINSSNHWMSIRSRFGGFEESSIITLLKAAQSVMSEYIMIKIIVDEDDKGVLFIVDQLSGSINDFKSFFARGMTNLQCAIRDFSNLL